MKKPTRDPMKRDLLTPKYRKRVVPSKKRLVKVKHKGKLIE